MKHYEITFIVDPVLSGDEVKATADMYLTQLKTEGCEIVHVNEWGLRQLAYPINKRSNGIYYVLEVKSELGAFITKLEIAFRRDERILRFLTIALDKFAVQYNIDKRAGKIGNRRKLAVDTQNSEREARNTAAAEALEAETPAVVPAVEVDDVVDGDNA